MRVEGVIVGPSRLALRASTSGRRSSERDFVVEVVALAAPAPAPAGKGRLALARPARARGAEIGRLDRIRSGPAARAIEHRQLRVEALQHHFGRVAVLAGLVLPFAGLQLALEIDLGALLEILLGNPTKPLVEDHDAVPLGALTALPARLVA